jgi:hypothetical protein
MPLLAKKEETKPDPARDYRCWMGHSGATGAVSTGQVLGGNDPRVISNPQFFVDDATAERDTPNHWHAVAARQEAEEAVRVVAELEAAKRNRVTLAAPRMFRVTRDVVANYQGKIATITKGSVILASDPLVGALGDALEEA